MNRAELKEEAVKHYTHFLEYTLQVLCLEEEKEPYFPYTLWEYSAQPDFCQDGAQTQEENRELYNTCKAQVGRGYSLNVKTIQTRSFGRRIYIERIFFETQEDFLYTAEKEAEIEALCAALSTVKEGLDIAPSSLHNWAQENINVLTNPALLETQYWENIVYAAQQCRIKNQPIENSADEGGVPLSFIEENRLVLQPLIPDIDLFAFLEKNKMPRKIERKKSPPFIRFRLLSLEHPLCIGESEVEVHEMALRQDDFSALSEMGILDGITHILIVQEESAYLSFPHFEHTLCILGTPDTIQMLSIHHWLTDYRLIFFGNLEEEALQSLSVLRTFFRNAQSLCMTLQTLQTFSPSVRQKEPLALETIPRFLTAEEREVFLALRHNPKKNCLLQEDIPLDYLAKAFAAFFTEEE